MAVKAFLVGINKYPDPKAELRGCVNDVARMQALLTDTYKLPAAQVRSLTDSAATKDAIVSGLQWLAERDDGETNPVRLFHFSGHGVQLPDTSHDEEEGTDEALVPYDYSWDNLDSFIADDQLAQLYADIGADTHFVAVMDCCHSGTNQRDLERDIVSRFMRPGEHEAAVLARQVSELRQQNEQRVEDIARERIRELWQRDNTIDQDRFNQMFEKAKQQVRKELFGRRDVPGNIVLLAACQDRQTAADAHLGGNYNGALTYYLTQTLAEAGEQLAYGALIDRLAAGLGADPALNQPGIECQVPQLECDVQGRDLLFLRDRLG